MTPDEWRDRVGLHLEQRRLAAGFSSRYQIAAASKEHDEIASLSESWIRQVERGEVRRNDGTVVAPNPRGNLLDAYLELIDWPADAIDRLVAGEDPDTLTRKGAPTTERPPWELLLEAMREVSDGLERLAERVEQAADE